MTIKRIIAMPLVIIILFTLSGCWNYKGLDTISLVAGLAIDKIPESDLFGLTFEIFDFSESSMDMGIKTRLVETQGESIFDAIRSTRRRLAHKLYFGNSEIIIISRDVAENVGIKSVIDFFLRDAEPRETTIVLLSKEKTARELLNAVGVNSSVVSTDIKDNISEDNKVVSKTYNTQIYDLFNTLECEGIDAVLPAFRLAKNDKEEVAESDGVAVFKGDYLVGYLSPDETKYLLYINDKAKGGTLVFKTKEQTITFEVAMANTKRSFKYDGNFITFEIKPVVDVYLNESSGIIDTSSLDEMRSYAQEGEKFLADNMLKVINKVIGEYDSDIFGFGNTIYKTNPQLWREIKDKKPSYLGLLKFNIKPKISIKNTGYMNY